MEFRPRRAAHRAGLVFWLALASAPDAMSGAVAVPASQRGVLTKLTYRRPLRILCWGSRSSEENVDEGKHAYRHCRALGHDLGAAWDHPAASPEIKKRILRTVIREVV